MLQPLIDSSHTTTPTVRRVSEGFEHRLWFAPAPLTSAMADLCLPGRPEPVVISATERRHGAMITGTVVSAIGKG